MIVYMFTSKPNLVHTILFVICVLFCFLILFPRFSYTYAAVLSGVYINEFLPQPSVGEEWVELYNPTSEVIDIGGWQIDDVEGGSTPYTISSGSLINPGQYRVFSFSAKLNNAGDSVRLLQNAVVIDEFIYTQSVVDQTWARNIQGEWELVSVVTKGFENTNTTITPIPTPTVIAEPTPFATPIPTSTPTPLLEEDQEMQIIFTTPQEVIAGEQFPVSLAMSNAEINKNYYLKVLIGQYEGSLYDGRTLGADGQAWLAWNASWVQLPFIGTDGVGSGSGTFYAKVDEDAVGGDYKIQVRLHLFESTENIDSNIQSITAIQALQEEVEDSETGDESLQNENETEQTSSELFLIADVKEMEDGESVMIEGVVISSFEELGSHTLYIEDESGGIKVVVKGEWGNELKRGKLIRLVGILKESFNERYLKVDQKGDITVLGEGDLPDPLELSTGMIGEDYEGQLVYINGEVVATSGNTFFIDDGSGEIKVYIKSTTGIDKPKMKTGYFAAIIGIVSQYKDEFRILPRFQDDVLVSTVPITGVLGALSVLPETGIGLKKYGIGFLLIGIGLVLRLVGILKEFIFRASKT